jgi:hypothetical protein
MTRVEAKKAYHGAYLYWRINASRHRCYSPTRPNTTKRARRVGAPSPTPEPAIIFVPTSHPVRIIPIYGGWTVIERIERAFNRLSSPHSDEP